jgi:hypothetical protein
MIRPNWALLGALLVSLTAWGALAEAGYRVSHHGQGGLRHAVYAKAVVIAHRLERLV